MIKILQHTILYLIVPPIYLFILYKQIKRRVSLVDYVLMFSFIIYLTGLVSITIFPIPIADIGHLGEPGVRAAGSSFIPFKDIYAISNSTTQFFRQVIGNIVLFIPLGCYLPIYYKFNHSKKAVVFTGIISSLIVEATQFMIGIIIMGFMYKTASIDDVILNTIGFCLGFIVYKFSLPILNSLQSFKLFNS